MRSIFAKWIVLGLLSLSNPSFADFGSAMIVSGRVASFNKTTVTLQSGTTLFRVPRKNIPKNQKLVSGKTILVVTISPRDFYVTNVKNKKSTKKRTKRR